MTIGDRIKRYEKAYDIKLTPRSFLVIRVDGKAFHTYTRGMEKPFDKKLIEAMVVSAEKTSKEMMGFKLGYIQSDEATFLLTDFDDFETQGWFNYELNKVVSISASLFTAFFNQEMGDGKCVAFDSRAFIVPKDDVANVFIWRQRDWERNSVQMLARANFSHKECHQKKLPDLHEMLHQKGINWAKIEPILKNGTFITPNGRIHEKLDYEQVNNLLNK